MNNLRDIKSISAIKRYNNYLMKKASNVFINFVIVMQINLVISNYNYNVLPFLYSWWYKTVTTKQTISFLLIYIVLYNFHIIFLKK